MHDEPGARRSSGVAWLLLVFGALLLAFAVTTALPSPKRIRTTARASASRNQLRQSARGGHHEGRGGEPGAKRTSRRWLRPLRARPESRKGRAGNVSEQYRGEELIEECREREVI